MKFVRKVKGRPSVYYGNYFICGVCLWMIELATSKLVANG